MRSHGALLRTNEFSSTWPGHPALAVEWVFQLLLASVHAAGGWAAVAALKALLVILLCGVLYALLLACGTPPRLAAPLVTIGLAAMHSRLAERPQLFSYLFFGTLIILLRRQLAQPSRLAWAIPLLFALWSNVHPELAVGLIYLGAALIGAILFPARETGARERAKGLLWPALCSLPATLLNPEGYRVLLLPVLTLLQEGAIRVFEHQPPGWAEARLFWLCLAATLVAMLAGRSDRPWGEDLPVLVMGLVAVRYRRAVPFFLIAALPMIGARLTRGEASGTRSRRVTRTALALAAAGALCWATLLEFPETFRWGWGINEKAFPAAAASFLLAEPWQGRLYNDYTEGGYLIHRLYPRMRVFQDGRVSAYPAGFIRRLHAGASPDDHRRLLREYDVRLLLRRRADVVPDGAQREWALVFWDDEWGVWARRAPPNLGLIERHEYRSFLPGAALPVIRDPQAGELLAREMRRNQAERLEPSPRVDVELGTILTRLKRRDEAERAFREAVRLDPRSAPGWAGLGLILADTPRQEAARQALARALELDPAHTLARARLDMLGRGVPGDRSP